MAYRGDDLDLRTPQSWSTTGTGGAREAGEQPNWWTRTAVYKGGRADPIWVDDFVMACCNHAYDLAVAHRAPEVRLEHLINALTLNEQAAQVLEARGFSVTSLRRESGASIANDIPAASGTSNGVPKRSEGMEEALRLAADHAYPRRTPVTVDDILHVLFDMKRDIPGLQLLHRNSGTWNGRNVAEPPRADLRLDPLPHLSRPTQQPAQWPRYSSPAAHDYFSQSVSREPAPAVREYVREPAREIVRVQAPATPVDSFQDTRLDSLERAVRDLGVDLADDRKTIRSLVSDLQRSSAVQADDAGRFHGGVAERLAALEDTMMRARNDGAAMPSALLDKLGAIERGIDGRLLEVGRMAVALGDRLQALEHGANRPVEATLSPLVSQRLESITLFGGKVEALERTFQMILDRMTGIERKLASGSDASAVERIVQSTVEKSLDLAPVTELLSGIEGRVVGLERTLENRTAETGRTVSFIGERLRSFEEAIGGQKTQTIDRLGQIERSLTAYAESTVSAGSSHENDLGEVHEALLKLNANQQTLAGSLDQWRLDNTGDLSVINNRLKSIEEAEERRGPQVQSLAGQVAAVHSALAKREVRKSRFLHWLFGTDEWYSASYDTKIWRSRQGETVQASRASADPVQLQPRPSPPAPPPSIVRR